MFIMPSDFLMFLKRVQERKQKQQEQEIEGQSNKKEAVVGPEIVPVDMGYPLMVFISVMILAVINKVLPSSETLKFVSLWALLYGLAMCIELMTFLFLSSRTIQKLRTKSEPEPKKLDI
ncbi:hypothetical protein RQY89_003551 [Vibrio alginolyticus]|nr:hypothetical protein [Vibrio alginolyticus]